MFINGYYYYKMLQSICVEGQVKEVHLEKCSKLGLALMWGGRAFHMLEQARDKARSQRVFKRVLRPATRTWELDLMFLEGTRAVQSSEK